jgi:predicted amidophosphoribosyltransferase
MLIAQATIPFGLLGVLIVVGFLVWLARSRSPLLMRECPYCKKRLRGDASVCPHCQRESVAWVEHEGYWWRQDQAGQWEYLRTDGSLRADGGQWMKSAATREP